MSTETELVEHIKIEGEGAATSALGRLAAAAGRVAHAFHGFTEIAGAFGGIAGLWKVAETIHEVDQLYAAVGRVKAMTGVAAENAHAMFDMFKLSGIGMEGSERILISLTRLTGKMGDGYAESAQQAEHLQKLMGKIGVAVKAGPEERLLAMSEAAQKGKLKINDLITAFNIPRTQASKMMSMLSGGPERLKEIRDQTMKGSAVINDRALAQYQHMVQIRRELSHSWEELIATLYKSVLPAVTVVLQAIQHGFHSIEPIVDRIGKFLSDHMQLVVSLTRTWLTMMLAAKAINMATMFTGGAKMGAFDRGKQLIGGASRWMVGKAAAAGGMDYFAAKAANPGAGMFASAGGGMTKVFGSLIGRLGILGAIVLAIVSVFRALKDSGGTFGRIWEKLKGIGAGLMAVFGKLWEAVKPIVELLGDAFVAVLKVIIWVLDKLVTALSWLVKMIVAIVNFFIFMFNKMKNWGVLGYGFDKLPDLAYIDLDKDAKKSAEESKRQTGEGKGDTINQDFRGSKFEIQNNFPEGIDGGRVAVAFGDELAKLGERRLDSGLRPLFSYR